MKEEVLNLVFFIFLIGWSMLVISFILYLAGYVSKDVLYPGAIMMGPWITLDIVRGIKDLIEE